MYARLEDFQLQFEQRPMFLNNIKLSRGAKDVYALLYSQFKNNITKVGEDSVGQYINLARSIIADKLEMSVKTVIKYINELVCANLIEDRRMGLNLVNRIYFKEHPAMVKVDDKTVNTDERTELLNKAREIIQPLTNKVLRDNQLNQILALCNDDLEELKKAVEYNFGKDIRNVVACLCDTLRNKYYNEVKTVVTVESKEVVKKSNTYIKPKKQNKFVDGCSNHDRDYEALQEQEREYIENMVKGVKIPEEFSLDKTTTETTNESTIETTKNDLIETAKTIIRNIGITEEYTDERINIFLNVCSNDMVKFEETMRNLYKMKSE